MTHFPAHRCSRLLEMSRCEKSLNLPIHRLCEDVERAGTLANEGAPFTLRS